MSGVLGLLLVFIVQTIRETSFLCIVSLVDVGVVLLIWKSTKSFLRLIRLILWCITRIFLSDLHTADVLDIMAQLALIRRSLRHTKVHTNAVRPATVIFLASYLVTSDNAYAAVWKLRCVLLSPATVPANHDADASEVISVEYDLSLHNVEGSFNFSSAYWGSALFDFI